MAKARGLSHAVLTGFEHAGKKGPRIVEYYDDNSNEVFDYPEEQAAEFDAHVAKLKHGHSVDYEEPQQDYQSFKRARNKQLAER